MLGPGARTARSGKVGAEAYLRTVPRARCRVRLNGQQGLPGSVEATHLLVRVPAPCTALLTGSGLATSAREAGGTARRRGLRALSTGQRPQASMCTCEPALHHLSHIQQQVPAICDLLGLGSSLCRRTGILGGAVPGEDFHSRVPPQPRSQRRCRAIRQQFDDTVRLQVDEDGPVSASFAQGPVINTEHPRSFRSGQWSAAHQAQERVRAGRHSQARQHPGPGFRARAHDDGTLGRCQATRPSGTSWQQTRELLGKRAAGACQIAAVEAAHTQLQLNGAPSGWQVGRAPNVGTVGRGAATVARRATSTFSFSTRQQDGVSRAMACYPFHATAGYRVQRSHSLLYWPLRQLAALASFSANPHEVRESHQIGAGSRVVAG